MISKAIAKMKTGKAARPSGKVIEVNSDGKEIFKSVTNFTNIIIKEGHFFQIGIFFVSLLKGKGDAISRGNIRGLKMQNQVMKLIEIVLDRVTRSQVDINIIQFGFILGGGTTNGIFIIRQLQEKHLGKCLTPLFCFC